MSEAAPPPGSLPPPATGAKPPASPAIRADWGPMRVLGGLGILLVATGIAAAIIAGFDPGLESLGAGLALQATLATALVAVAFGLAAAHPGPGAARSLGLGASLRSPWGPSVVAYVVYIGAAIVLAVLFQPEQKDIARELGYGDGAVGDIAIGLLIVIAAPVSEEIFFRGFMFGGIRSRAPFAVAAVISAAVWGLFHYTGSDSWPVVLQLAVFGVILAWLYERTGSIRAPIAIHAINNAIAFAILTAD